MNHPALSSNTLFHFTQKRENLISILTNNFFACWGMEDLQNLIPEYRPMFAKLCFCDLPLSQTGNHLKIYGKYGIGLTKKWGQKNGISPVLYLHEDSNLLNTFADMSRAASYDPTKNVELPELRDLILRTERYINVSFYFKPYTGDFIRKGMKHENIRFYDEREWRWIPRNANFRDVFVTKELDSDRYDRKNKEILDKTLQLEFQPEDVRYIVVKSERQIPKMIDAVFKIMKKKYPRAEDKIMILTTRIISAEQIHEDF